MTVAEAWRSFKVTRKPDPGNTQRRHDARMATFDRHYTMHIEPHLGPVKLADLTPGRLRAWVNPLAAKPTARPGELNEDKRTLAASTIRSAVTTLRQIAKANDVPLQVMLAESLRQKRQRSRPRAFQSIQDVRALVEACAAQREDAPKGADWFKVAAAIACYCGARVGEVASLRWRHVGKETITIALSWEGPLKHRYEDDDEDEAAHIVPLSPELAAILAAWRKVTKGKAEDIVVLVGGKRPLREGYDDVAQKTRSACKRAGLTPITSHSLRASYATLVADQGLPVGKLAALLGHADVSTTAIYIRPESERAAQDPRAPRRRAELS